MQFMNKTNKMKQEFIALEYHNIYKNLKTMSQKPIILIIDNRGCDADQVEPPKNMFKCSGFKATEVDPADDHEKAMEVANEFSFISQLEQRVSKLETRVTKLQKQADHQKLERRHRRKANQIAREFQCPHEECAKYYGSETSLKNHIKLKHSKSGLV